MSIRLNRGRKIAAEKGVENIIHFRILDEQGFTTSINLHEVSSEALNITNSYLCTALLRGDSKWAICKGLTMVRT